MHHEYTNKIAIMFDYTIITEDEVTIFIPRVSKQIYLHTHISYFTGLFHYIYYHHFRNINRAILTFPCDRRNRHFLVIGEAEDEVEQVLEVFLPSFPNDIRRHGENIYIFFIQCLSCRNPCTWNGTEFHGQELVCQKPYISVEVQWYINGSTVCVYYSQILMGACV